MVQLISGLRWAFCWVSQADMPVSSPPVWNVKFNEYSKAQWVLLWVLRRELLLWGNFAFCIKQHTIHVLKYLVKSWAKCFFVFERDVRRVHLAPCLQVKLHCSHQENMFLFITSCHLLTKNIGFNFLMIAITNKSSWKEYLQYYCILLSYWKISCTTKVLVGLKSFINAGTCYASLWDPFYTQAITWWTII